MEPYDVIYQEQWQSGWTPDGCTVGFQIGGRAGLKIGGTEVSCLLKIMVLREKIILRPMFLIHRLLPKFFYYEIPFGSIVRCDVYKKGILGKGIELEFRDQAGTSHLIQFTAKDPDKIKQLCAR